MPFSNGGVTVIINNGGGGGGSGYPDVNPADAIVDEANRITLDGVTVEPQEVKDLETNVTEIGTNVGEMEEDIVDLENNKMNKVDPVDGGGF